MAYNKDTQMYEGYIYQISNNFDKKIYIGQTSTSLTMRWYQHKNAAKKDYRHYRESILYNAMKKHGFENFEITMLDKVENKTIDGLLDALNTLETFYIIGYQTLSPNGYNLSMGGNNSSERYKRAVDAYDASGNLIMSYSSIAEAIRMLGGKTNHAISSCCRGKTNSCVGFIWRYKGEPFDKYPIKVTQEMLDKYNNETPVDQYDLQGNFIASYSKIRCALDANGIDRTYGGVITQCCKGIRNEAHGFVWRKRGEPFDKYDFKNPSDWTAVDVYDLNTEEMIGSYKSINEALRQLGLKDCHGSVTLNCQGQTKSVAKKYVFRYHGDAYDKYGNPKVRKPKETKPIAKYTPEGVYVGLVKSARDEGHKLHISPNNILNCCKDMRSTHLYKGYLWYYADDPNQPDKTKMITA